MTATGTETATRKVVIYTSIYHELLDKLGPALKVRFPDLDVEFVTKGGTEHLIAKLESEFNAGIQEADAIMLADPAYARLLKQQGRLQSYVSPGAAKVVVDKDPAGAYTGVRVIDVVILYNTNLVKSDAAPRSFKDLLDPKWKGQVAFPDPTKSGSTLATVGALVQKYDWEFFRKAEANAWQFGGSSSSAPEKVSTGKAKVGVAIEQQYLLAKREGKPMGMVWPEDGTIVLDSPYAILKNARNPDGARQVLDWILTPEAQTLLTQGEMHPAISGIPAPAGSIPLDKLLARSMKMDWDRYALERDQVSRLIAGIVTIKG